MPKLLDCNIDENLVVRLNERAAVHQPSAEAELEPILQQALQSTKPRSFAEALAVMPDVGIDADFARVN
jgi:antitoxin FitA